MFGSLLDLLLWFFKLEFPCLLSFSIEICYLGGQPNHTHKKSNKGILLELVCSCQANRRCENRTPPAPAKSNRTTRKWRKREFEWQPSDYSMDIIKLRKIPLKKVLHRYQTNIAINNLHPFLCEQHL